MLTPLEYSKIWKEVVDTYNKTKNLGPNETVDKILENLSFSDVKETFAAVAAIKSHDGRIYGKNRTYMNEVEVNPDGVVWESRNPFIYAGLDDIHTTHINQLIDSLRKIEEKEQEVKENQTLSYLYRMLLSAIHENKNRAFSSDFETRIKTYAEHFPNSKCGELVSSLFTVPARTMWAILNSLLTKLEWTVLERCQNFTPIV